MAVIPENASNSDNEEEEQGRNQQGQGEDNQAGVTGQAPEGTEQLQDQGNTGTTVGQEEHQNNGTTERQQDHTIRTAMTITVHLQIEAPTEAHAGNDARIIERSHRTATARGLDNRDAGCWKVSGLILNPTM